MSKLITVDQSYTATAWVVWEDQQPKSFGVIYSDKTQSMYERAERIAKEINKVVNEHEPQHFVIEQLAYGGFGNATRDLAGLLWVIMVSLKKGTHLGYDDVTLVAPTSAKKVHTGNGKAKKIDMLNAVPEDVVKKFSKHFNKTKGLYDLADCYAFGVWYFKRLEDEKK